MRKGTLATMLGIASRNNNSYEQLPVCKLELGEYVYQSYTDEVIQHYINNPEQLKYELPDLSASHRDGSYYLICGFALVEALKKLGIESVSVQVYAHSTIEQEIEMYETLNNWSHTGMFTLLRNRAKKIDSDDGIRHLVHDITSSYKDIARINFQGVWRCIPKAFLYRVYKAVLNRSLSDTFDELFESELLDELHKLNKHETVDNTELSNRLDSNGYLTIYHGHVNKTLRNAYIWTTEPEIAHCFGYPQPPPDDEDEYYTCAEQKDITEYYIVTGKVKLADVVAYIPEQGEGLIVVLNKNVKCKTKKAFNVGEVSSKYASLEDVKMMVEQRRNTR